MKPPHTNLRFQISQAKRTLRRRLSQRDFISQLPPELLSSIARHVVDDADNSELAFPLAGISRRWRAVLLGDRTLWGTLILNGKDDRRKVDAFLANGELTTLNYRSREQQLLGALEGLEGQGGALKRLVFFLSGERESTDHHHLSKLWSTLFDASGPAPLPLRRLQIYSYGATDNPVDLPASSLVNLQTLDVRAGTLVLRSANPFPNLRTLSLTLQSLQTSSSSSPASSPPTHLTSPSLPSSISPSVEYTPTPSNPTRASPFTFQISKLSTSKAPSYPTSLSSFLPCPQAPPTLPISDTSLSPGITTSTKPSSSPTFPPYPPSKPFASAAGSSPTNSPKPSPFTTTDRTSSARCCTVWTWQGVRLRLVLYGR